MEKTTTIWEFQTAKARFSELFRRARTEGPQYVTRHGKEAVVVMPAKEFEKLKRRRPNDTLAEFFARSPLVGSGLKLELNLFHGRKAKL
jgi:prevent-host-death family protein